LSKPAAELSRRVPPKRAIGLSAFASSGYCSGACTFWAIGPSGGAMRGTEAGNFSRARLISFQRPSQSPLPWGWLRAPGRRGKPGAPPTHASDLVDGYEAKMRVFSISLFALASLVQAHAQGTAQGTAGTDRKSEASLSDACHYTIGGYSHEVPAGVNLCWRVRYP
jgi:hypothetical protein